jgi:hypothetical protein
MSGFEKALTSACHHWPWPGTGSLTWRIRGRFSRVSLDVLVAGSATVVSMLIQGSLNALWAGLWVVASVAELNWGS